MQLPPIPWQSLHIVNRLTFFDAGFAFIGVLFFEILLSRSLAFINSSPIVFLSFSANSILALLATTVHLQIYCSSKPDPPHLKQ